MALEAWFRVEPSQLVPIKLGLRQNDEEIQALVEGRGDGEELAEIPRYLSSQDDNGDPIPPEKKAKIIRFKRN